MNNRRIRLQTELEHICDNVYFEPPESIKLKYPAIIYTRNNIHLSSADDINYKMSKGYKITVIDKDPDSEILKLLIDKFSMLSFEQHFKLEGFNHDIFSLYY